MLGFVIGVVVGYVFGFISTVCFLATSQNKNNEQIISDGIIKLNGRYFELHEIDL